MVDDDAPIKRDKTEKEVRTVILIVPFGVPGYGKSTIWKNLKAHIESLDPALWTCDSVSSDGIRASVMKPLLDAGKTKKQAFDATAKSGPAAYGQEFGKLCS